MSFGSRLASPTLSLLALLALAWTLPLDAQTEVPPPETVESEPETGPKDEAVVDEPEPESPDEDSGRLPSWLQDYPVTLTQFLVYLYHNLPDFMATFMTEDVLTALVGTIFPTLSASASAGESPEKNKAEVILR